MREGRDLSGILFAVFAVLAVPVAAGGLVFAVTRGANPEVCACPAEGVATVYLIDDGRLTATNVGVVGVEPSPRAVLASLFERAGSDGQVNAWAGDKLLGLRRDGPSWLVNVARAPSAPGTPATLVLQQLAWTLSDATQSSAPIEVDVRGAPLTVIDGARVGNIGVPDPRAVSPTGMSARSGVPASSRGCTSRRSAIGRR